jgi:competence protein ComEC
LLGVATGLVVGGCLAIQFGLAFQLLALCAAGLWFGMRRPLLGVRRRDQSSRLRDPVAEFGFGLALGVLAPGGPPTLALPFRQSSTTPGGDPTRTLRLQDAVVLEGGFDPMANEWRGSVGCGGRQLDLTWIAPPAPPLSGDRLAGLARWTPAARPLCEVEAQRLGRQRRAGHQGRLQARGNALAVRPAGFGPLRWAERLRRAACRTIHRHLAPDRAALVCQLALGGGGGEVPAATRFAHRAAGTSHFLAVSGMHVGLLWSVMRLCTARAPPRLQRTTGLLRALTIVFYGLLCGWRPPVVRAIGGLLLFEVARATGRRFDPATAMAVTAALTGLLAPRELGGPGFWLSYAAVAGIVWFTPSWRRLHDRDRPALLGWLLRLIATSIAAWLATAPLCLWWFGQCSPWSVVATPLLLPWILVLLIGGLALGLLPAPELVLAALGTGMDRLASGYLAITDGIALLPGAPLRAASGLTTPPVLVAGAAGAVLLCWRFDCRRLGLTCALLIAGFLTPWPGQVPAQLRLLPVGHGLSCFVATENGHRLLLDCGSIDRQAPARRIVLPTLRRLGVTALDDVVVTHADQDHVGDVETVLQDLPVRRLFVPAQRRLRPIQNLARRLGITVQVVLRGQRVPLAEGLELWAPPIQEPSASDNDTGLVLLVEWGATHCLLLADQQELGVAAILTEPELRTDVLLAPHHGRPNQLSRELLRRTAPTLVLVSDGVRFGATPEAATYGEFARCLRTSVHGEVVVWPVGSAFEVQSYWPDRRPH